MASRTQLYEYHRKNGNLVEYAGYNLPVWYEGIIAECRTVREHTGIFDVSHMGRVIVDGRDSARFLDHVTTNDVSSLALNKGHYSLFCNREGGIIDDLTVFRLGPARFMVVYNAANRGKNWEWLLKNRGQFKVDLSDVSNEVAMFAVQGQGAASALQTISGLELEEIERYSAIETKAAGIFCLVTRTGYTGEDGFEIYVWNSSPDKPESAVHIWNSILRNAVHPIGLGARDVLRLEAGMCLYGNDIDEKTSPVQAKLMFVTRLEKPDFVGKDKIASEKLQGPFRIRIGFKIIGKGIPRNGQEIFSPGVKRPIGTVTSGTLSPTLGDSIGMGYVDPDHSDLGRTVEVRVRDRNLPAALVKLPFYQRRSKDKVVVYGQEMGLKAFRESRTHNPVIAEK